ncbi:MAG: nucleotide pyrophosphohydrolase [Phycisphaerales bacterium]
MSESAATPGSPAPTHDLRVLQAAVACFAAEREWGQFHDPKSLAMAIGVEAGELMEHFRWLGADAAHQAMADPRTRREAGEEVADVLILLLEFANVTGLDLGDEVSRKLAKNAARYPVELARGSSAKYDRLTPPPGAVDPTGA